VAGQFGNWVFGCDICQDVCPWNRFSKPTQETQFQPNPELKNLSASDWQDITHEVFQALFKQSPLKRTGYEGLKRNIRFVTGQSQLEG
jgi:epoxyqueuosine reductase